jgi:hypothetical protein
MCSRRTSTFTEGEIDKLKRYTSVDNWTQVTMQMFFPFLMCEVKCGREGLDIADRQNMHSCSVAECERTARSCRGTSKAPFCDVRVLNLRGWGGNGGQ